MSSSKIEGAKTKSRYFEQGSGFLISPFEFTSL